MLWGKKKDNGIQLDRKLSRDEINDLPIGAYKGPIELIRDHRAMLAAGRKLKKEKILGFDTETRPAFRKGVSYPPALLQLAGKDRVYIFRLTEVGDLAPLFELLADRNILKVGVSVTDDVKELRELEEFAPAGFIDIGDCARDYGMKHHGLRGMGALLLGFRITKSGSRYNWAKKNLPDRAISYAATDAWIGRELYLTMKKLGCITRKHSNPLKVRAKKKRN